MSLKPFAAPSVMAGGLDGERIFLVGTFPPQQCGIATFTEDLARSIAGAAPEAALGVVAVAPSGDVDQPAADFVIDRNDPGSYVRVAARLNARGASLILLQHEFGIFGGEAGEHILAFLDAIEAPVVVTLHTVSPDFNAAERRVLAAIARRADKLVVLAEKGREMLIDAYGLDPGDVAFSPHGVHPRPRPDAEAFKARFGWSGRDVLLSFGLVGRGKGFETMIRAMPAIAARRPDALYVVLGATHPNVLAEEGEAYREELATLAADLGVADHVLFINRFTERDELLDYLSAADIYVAAYPNPRQIVSGTLAYAYALGKPILATPFWYAEELLANGRGVLRPAGDAAAFAEGALTLLENPLARDRMAAAAFERGRRMHWPTVAEDYVEILSEARDAARSRARKVVSMQTKNAGRWRAPLAYIERMTDDVGILQHATMDVANRHEGYCVDDNARALLAMTLLDEADRSTPASIRLERIYASFVNSAFNKKTGRFRNFMAYDRKFLEEKGSEDSHGRTLHALAHARLHAESADRRAWADWLFFEALDASDDFESPRAVAHVVNALAELEAAAPGRAAIRGRLRQHADFLYSRLKAKATGDWFWFEDVLAYENALLPAALIAAARALGDERMRQDGLRALGWLSCVQTAEDGWFRPVGTGSFGVPRALPTRFDQQPLDAYATVAACRIADRADPAGGWAHRARTALDWFGGRNDIGRMVYDPTTGSCCDGLHPDRENKNKGAEACLSALMAHTLVDLIGVLGESGTARRRADAS